MPEVRQLRHSGTRGLTCLVGPGGSLRLTGNQFAGLLIEGEANGPELATVSPRAVLIHREAISVRVTADNPPVPDSSPPDRLRGLIDAGIALGSELSLDDLLQKLVETAADLTGARYAALGVIDETGTELERFLTTGIGPEMHTAIGELPRGRGILGVLIKDAKPLRLESIGGDPRSVGFPPNHPPMRGFLGVPILLRGRAFGNLYLTEKVDGPFTGEDQALVETLASQAAVAIENAGCSGCDELVCTARGAQRGRRGTGRRDRLPRLLQLICLRLGGLINARVVTIALPASEGR